MRTGKRLIENVKLNRAKASDMTVKVNINDALAKKVLHISD